VLVRQVIELIFLINKDISDYSTNCLFFRFNFTFSDKKFIKQQKEQQDQLVLSLWFLVKNREYKQ
jgi:hypothetical protein